MTLKSKELGLLIVLKNKWNCAGQVCKQTTVPPPDTSININYVNFAWLVTQMWMETLFCHLYMNMS
jgi:hypothetical protein